MLPYFFRHYDPWVDHYFLFDDGSSDRTVDIALAHPRVTLETFPRSHPESFVLSEQEFSNQAWKTSKSAADWIIFTDIDEHLFHPLGRAYFKNAKLNGVTAIPALGFQMISERLPESGSLLCQTIVMGMPWEKMLKMSVFDPSALDESHYQPGRHVAKPEGHVVVPKVDELLLFHFKYLGYQKTKSRHHQLKTGLGGKDLDKNWGHKYSWSEEEFKRDWDFVLENAVDTRLFRGLQLPEFPLEVWWENMRQAN